MALPTFLGIGAQKAGTTWLYRQCLAHPQIFMPIRKEIHFFNRNYDKGLAWYERFFTGTKKPSDYKAVGEISPYYLEDEQTPGRIAETLGKDTKLIVMLRNPVNRLYSDWKMNAIFKTPPPDIENYTREESIHFRRGCYAPQLEHYFKQFPRENMLVLIYEELFAGPQATKTHLGKIAAFLGVDPLLFPEEEQQKIVNDTAGRPRFNRLYLLAANMRIWLERSGLKTIVRLAHKLGVSKKSFGGLKELPPLPDNIRARLQQQYEPHIRKTEEILGHDLNVWR